MNITTQPHLSDFLWDLKRKNKKFEVNWEILDRGEPFSPITNKCALCDKEKFYISFRAESASIDLRDEIFSSYRHKRSKLLITKERKKVGPG